MLSEIADGIELTERQRDRGIATVDETDKTLAEGLVEHADELPCQPATAATVVDTYTAGRSVGDVAREAGVTPMTAAKTLHLLGIEGLSPLAPRAREIVRDWQRGELSRTDAETLVQASETEFALAAFIEAHDPIDGVTELTGAALAEHGDAAVDKRDRLAETMSGVGELR